jgi:hypothetical protein
MSRIAVNQLEATTGTEISVAPGETFAADSVRANSFQARTFGNAIPVTASVVHPPVVLTSTGTVAINFALGNTFKITLTGNPTFTFSNLTEGGFYIIHLNPNGSSRNLTWPVSGIMWSGSPLTALVAGNRYMVTVSYFDSIAILTAVIATQ